MTANTVPTVEELGGVKQDTVQWPAKAHRVTQTDSDGDEITDRNPLNVTLPDQIKDIDDNGIAKSQNLPTIIPLNYGFDTTNDYWTRFLTEYDNDDVPGGQTPQLVLPLNYYWEAKSNTWKRWQGESGSIWTYIVNWPATDYEDDGAFTVASNRGVAIGGIATADSVNPNDFGVLKITTDRSLVVTNDNITDASQKTQLVDGDGDVAEIKTDGTDNAQVVFQNIQPLPTGAATAANQTTEITHLASIDAASVTSNEGDNLRTSNVNQEEVLENVLLELKKMNIQLAMMTDNELKEEN